MPIGPPYWKRMVYSKNGKWSAVCLIEYVWSNIFQLTVPAYVLMSMYRLFGTEEYHGKLEKPSCSSKVNEDF